ncbi:MAG: hypothetical protein ACRDL2_16050 [Gaiellaceae bacterium]
MSSVIVGEWPAWRATSMIVRRSAMSSETNEWRATLGPPPGGPAYCVPSGTGLLTIRPGTYWVTVNDPLDSHNFELRSCPGSTAPCGPGQGVEQQLTPVCNDDLANSDVFKCGTNTETAANDIVKTVVVHEAAGMYVDIEVGGVGQVG